MKTILRKRIFKINSKLLAESKTLQFKVNNISPELEKELNIGIFQLDDYIAFYINLTAYGHYVESVNRTNRIRYIEISVGRSYVDDDTGEIETDSGTHLVVFPYETKCGGSRFTSDPAIINYYRQFFMQLDEKVIDAKDGFSVLHPRNRKGDRYNSSILSPNTVTSRVLFVLF